MTTDGMAYFLLFKIEDFTMYVYDGFTQRVWPVVANLRTDTDVSYFLYLPIHLTQQNSSCVKMLFRNLFFQFNFSEIDSCSN